MLKNKSSLENLIVFIFCFAVLLGPAYTLFDSYSYDTVANPDIKTYLGIANFDFDQSPIRKYRVIIPFIAAGIDFVFHPLFSSLAPYTFPGPNFSLCLSFLIVNCTFMSIFGLLVYRLCKAFDTTRSAAFIGILSILTCRWTLYLVGLPLVDSLYLVVIAMTLLGIKTQNTKLIILAIFIGPWAKESFIFIAPLIFFFSHIKKWNQIVLFFFSAVVVFSFRYYFDTLSNSVGLGLENDFAHFNKIQDSLKRLFSFHGVYEILSIAGIWGILFLLIFKKSIRTVLQKNTSLFLILFLIIVFIHAILSTELARMFYLATPVMAIWFALIVDQIICLYGKKNSE